MVIFHAAADTSLFTGHCWAFGYDYRAVTGIPQAFERPFKTHHYFP
jgi:hypothetical protein